ncbi:MAG: SIMPL domain-containing protein [Bacteroidota bacterium]
MNNTKIFTSAIIAFAIVFSSLALRNAWVKGKKGNERISVTGLASKDFVSDLIVWKGNFSRMSMNTAEAFNDLKRDADMIKTYLISKGVTENEIVFSSVTINKQFQQVQMGENNWKQVFIGNQLTQQVQIESREVDKIERISRDITELIGQQIELNSIAPNYFYTKLADLKIEMLAAATKDGRTRAEKIAENSKTKISGLNNADMGIFQITAQNSTEDYSWGGAFNTSSKNKTASITVKLNFNIN